MALGAGGARLVRQFLTEAVALAAIATAGGVALAYASLGWLVSQAPAGIPRLADARIDARVLIVTLLAGVAWLAWQVNWTTALLGVASWVTYVVIYTPLKRISPANTAVGAVAGAIPILMGWTATGAPIDLTAMTLAGVLFLWQFPHFMAIAWLYRGEYAKAGHQMLTVVDPTGARAGALATDQYRLGRPRSLAELSAAFDRVTLADLNRYLERRTLGPATIFTLGPTKLTPPTAS